MDTINPMKLRMLSKDATNMAGTTDECALLQNFYTRSNASYQSILATILQKMSCTIQGSGDENIFGQTHNAAPEKTK